jgi:pyruvate/2-oxoglutarate/acetoin dehydrogenase E1 component
MCLKKIIDCVEDDMRRLSYSLSINEALHQMMAGDDRVFLIGQGVKSPWYVGNTARGLLDRFGPERVIDTPVSENAVTGAAVGASLVGMRPIVVHPRVDFMMYALDPIINEAANWSYMFGGRSHAPLVVWGIVNRGGEQAAQHSQALHALFAHIPGLKVVAPSNPYDAKGLMISAITDDNPVIYIDDRWLYDVEGDVPEEVYSIPIGKGVVTKKGKDVTLVSSSYMVLESVKAADMLEESGISAEVIDLRSIKPFDADIICESVARTGKLVVVDGGWRMCGFSAEVSALVNETMFRYLKRPVMRIALPDCPAPASSILESEYYPTADNIADLVAGMINVEEQLARDAK